MRLLLFLLLFTTFSARAFNQSEVLLRLNDNSSFTYIFDNVFYSNPCLTSGLNNVVPGRHYLQIISGSPNYFNKTIYNGEIYVQASSKYLIVVDPYNGRNYNFTIPLSINGFNPIINLIVNNPFPHHNPNTFGTRNYTPQPYFNFNDENSYSKLKELLASTPFSNKKLAIAQQAIFLNDITSKQVAELMLFFDFDIERTEFAAYAYLFTVDKENFDLTYKSFIFQGSIINLQNKLGYYTSAYPQQYSGQYPNGSHGSIIIR